MLYWGTTYKWQVVTVDFISYFDNDKFRIEILVPFVNFSPVFLRLDLK